MTEKTSYRTKSRDKMKTVDVVFVSDDQIGELVLSRKEFEKMQQKRLKEEAKDRPAEEAVTPKGKKRKPEEVNEETPKKPRQDADAVELALAALENVDVETETVGKPSTLFDENGDVAAGKMCSFEPRRTSLAKKAVINSSKKLERIEEDPLKTPYSLRKRVINDIKTIQRILENSDDERDFSASSGSDFSAGSSSDEESTPISSGKSLTRLPREALRNLETDDRHRRHLSQLFRTQLALFAKWDFLLRHNYNLLLYGIGSKKEVIEKFLARSAARFPVIQVNGFFPSVTAKDILDRIGEALKINAVSVEAVKARLDEVDVAIYLGINNIDGLMLRNRKSQQLLARLAAMPGIRVIATVDHINAPLLWDHCLLTDLNWVWMDATTFLPYADETSYEGSILLQSSGQLTLASLRSVFNSLTRNARQLFLILARQQVAAEKGWLGMAFRELYHEGRRQLLVSTDSALRLQLKEFIDHAVVKQKRSPEGEEKYYIALDTSIVKQFLDQQET